eukprot:scaffold208156_cov26-Tisochrysis_lutea.AAC.1
MSKETFSLSLPGLAAPETLYAVMFYGYKYTILHKDFWENWVGMCAGVLKQGKGGNMVGNGNSPTYPILSSLPS